MEKQILKTTSQSAKKDKDNVCATFVRKTYELVEGGKHTEFIKWMPEGDGFVIKRSREFAQEVLPKYFKHDKMSSFMKQLNMYNFKRIKRTDGCEYAFQHENFQRGSAEKLHLIQRRPSQNPAETSRNETDPEGGFNYNFEALSEENQTLKKMKIENSGKLQFLEAKADELSGSNQMLSSQIEKQNEESSILEEVIKYLMKYPGSVDMFGKMGAVPNETGFSQESKHSCLSSKEQFNKNLSSCELPSIEVQCKKEFSYEASMQSFDGSRFHQEQQTTKPCDNYFKRTDIPCEQKNLWFENLHTKKNSSLDSIDSFLEKETSNGNSGASYRNEFELDFTSQCLNSADQNDCYDPFFNSFEKDSYPSPEKLFDEYFEFNSATNLIPFQRY